MDDGFRHMEDEGREALLSGLESSFETTKRLQKERLLAEVLDIRNSSVCQEDKMGRLLEVVTALIRDQS